MDELKNKTDDELQEIMRLALPNQYVPSSIFNRAKQELEFRADAAREQEKGLTTIARAVLRSIAGGKMSTDATGKFIHIETLGHQFGAKHMPQVYEALQQLIQQNYVEELDGHKDVFRMTPFGTDYLADSATTSVVNYSHISNSNIAHGSHDVSQVIDVQELPEDIKRSIEELRDAAGKRDSPRMKKAFAYLADKAVDVAIAIALGHIKFGS